MNIDRPGGTSQPALNDFEEEMQTHEIPSDLLLWHGVRILMTTLSSLCIIGMEHLLADCT